MKTLLLSSTLAALVLGTLPASASVFDAGSRIAGMQAFDGSGQHEFDRRGRGRGGDDRGRGDRGGDDDRRRDDDRARDRGRRDRVPGGSGCDSARDRAEHAECRG